MPATRISHPCLPIPTPTAPASTPNSNAKYLQEDDINQECKTLIASLPKSQGWVLSHLYLYQGFWHPSRQLQGVLTCQAHFQARDTDLLLITAPKSGTTWLKAIMHSIVCRAKWCPRDVNHPILTSSPHDLIPFLELRVYVDHQVPDLTGLPSPRVFATHLPVGSLPESVFKTGCKIVYLCRDPKDVCISLWHFANKLRPKDKGKLPLEEAFDKFCDGVSLYGPFWDHVLGYWKYCLDNPTKVFFLKYEDLKKQPTLYLKRLAEFCGCPFTKEEENEGVVEEILELCSFSKLSNLEVNRNGKLSSGEANSSFFRKGQVGDWANYFTPEVNQRFDKISEEKLDRWGLRF